MRSIATNVLSDVHQQFDWRNMQSYYNGSLHDPSIAHPPPPPLLRQHHDNGDDDDALSIPFPVPTQSSYVYSFSDPVATGIPIHSHLGVPTNQYAAYTPSDISSMFTMPMNDSILEHGDVVHTNVHPDDPEQQDLSSPESVRSFMPAHLSPSHSPANTRSLQDFPTTATLQFEPASQKQSLISTVFPPRTAEDHMLNFDAATHTFPKRAKASNQTEADPYAAAFLQDQIGDEKWNIFSARLYERRLGGTKARFRGKKAPDGPEPRSGGASAIEFLVKVEVVKEVLRVYVPHPYNPFKSLTHPYDGAPSGHVTLTRSTVLALSGWSNTQFSYWARRAEAVSVLAAHDSRIQDVAVALERRLRRSPAPARTHGYPDPASPISPLTSPLSTTSASTASPPPDAAEPNVTGKGLDQLIDAVKRRTGASPFLRGKHASLDPFGAKGAERDAPPAPTPVYTPTFQAQMYTHDPPRPRRAKGEPGGGGGGNANTNANATGSGNDRHPSPRFSASRAYSPPSPRVRGGKRRGRDGRESDVGAADERTESFPVSDERSETEAGPKKRARRG